MKKHLLVAYLLAAVGPVHAVSEVFVSNVSDLRLRVKSVNATGQGAESLQLKSGTEGKFTEAGFRKYYQTPIGGIIPANMNSLDARIVASYIRGLILKNPGQAFDITTVLEGLNQANEVVCEVILRQTICVWLVGSEMFHHGAIIVKPVKGQFAGVSDSVTFSLPRDPNETFKVFNTARPELEKFARKYETTGKSEYLTIVDRFRGQRYTLKFHQFPWFLGVERQTWYEFSHNMPPQS